MKVLIIGSGGREHALVSKVAENPSVKKVYCAPGNGGSQRENKCENINITKIDELLSFALENRIDITIVGSEELLVQGIVDKFNENGLKILGPSQKAARLEGSKSYSKEFMKKYGIKTAAYEVFENENKALEYLKKCEYPIVIKADGLAAGKGVVICNDLIEAKTIINDFMILDIFKGSGKKIIIEEFLEGVEASILSITDGKIILPFISSKDHKQIFDGDMGPNTGGMGVIAPNPYCNKTVLDEFEKHILGPTLVGIQEEAMDYKGIIFFGIMITSKGVYLLEYNVRFGDPETQAVLPLMKSDFVELVISAIEGDLQNFELQWNKGYSCCVIAASKGYPGRYDTGIEINEDNKLEGKLFVAGAKEEEGVLKTSGGRVLGITGLGETLDKARDIAYADMKKIQFDGMYYRRDIGK
ncbi:phosphoribosylamine--glycine ligase [Clostridium tagluense]|uniref:phosphoribosylamine--glycine ligase n=1 Tax=Clostridium tagluense TaxID=360422 RepID=UPI001CF3C0EF|nr:phosphoribosylamine--glycine ligase [Clostridium tagluense]MCB2310080.1 phosphoribosylamine--glycine ligase [Clostridium tagluense]MCB2314390.1 phosphoribosylamine--glycine ligase [Clostridium tagluense]MCB2319236.1 phosphoribosylamine--glycine ligase [Clostridium tagluense]MCB2324674.1 phosphoribosylamine--glycine ligase [Clostridium tagluense]MCB2329525.1 phosphoribosylamine--glycine ligase [Clostridium tagluense]